MKIAKTKNHNGNAIGGKKRANVVIMLLIGVMGRGLLATSFRVTRIAQGTKLFVPNAIPYAILET